jgi:uncharacterized protein YyaL (SSP411 family)
VNRLAREKSPYLLQHARNPVDWYPWGTEAFATARERGVPIFLSVGYAACHWCHVMERESFEDAAVAEILNRHFVPVKVDREELPNVDHLYMTFCQAMTGSGGWPLTVFLSPEGKPFFAGTYFPKQTRQGRAGLLEVLPQIAQLWTDRREDVLNAADGMTAKLGQRMSAAGGGQPGPGTLAEAFEELARIYDPGWGGFGRAPKFPGAPWLLFLLRYARREGGDRARAMAEETLRVMRLGGIWDHLGGGFHRYAIDRQWLVPHFEKMLYDQALLALAYTEAFLHGGDPAFRRVAEEIFAYVLRDLQAPDGGFAAAEDADSEGEEGRFYLWTEGEVRSELGADTEAFADLFHLAADGNFAAETGERDGRNILHRLPPLAASAADFRLDAAGLPPALDAAREKLLAVRQRRVRPLRDDKVLTDWNGLMIAALARGAAAFGEPRYAEAAARAADFILARLRGPGGRLLHRYRDGEAAFPANLDDCAFLAWGLLELHGATGDARRLEQARLLAGEMIARYADERDGGFFFAAADEDPPLPLRLKIAADASLPSGNAVAAEVLLRLARLTGEAALEERARGVVRALAGELERSPLACAQLLSVLMQLDEPREPS